MLSVTYPTASSVVGSKMRTASHSRSAFVNSNGPGGHFTIVSFVKENPYMLGC